MVQAEVDVVEAVTNILADPGSIPLVAMGGLLIGFTLVLTGYLALGAVVDLVTPDSSREPPQRA